MFAQRASGVAVFALTASGDIAVATIAPIYWRGHIVFPGGVLASTGVVR